MYAGLGFIEREIALHDEQNLEGFPDDEMGREGEESEEGKEDPGWEEVAGAAAVQVGEAAAGMMPPMSPQMWPQMGEGAAGGGVAGGGVAGAGAADEREDIWQGPSSYGRPFLAWQALPHVTGAVAAGVEDEGEEAEAEAAHWAAGAEERREERAKRQRVDKGEEVLGEEGLPMEVEEEEHKSEEEEEDRAASEGVRRAEPSTPLPAA